MQLDNVNDSSSSITTDIEMLKFLSKVFDQIRLVDRDRGDYEYSILLKVSVCPMRLQVFGD